MQQEAYGQAMLAGATGMDLVLALYDGALRGLHRAAQCCGEDDVIERRLAVKKVVDIFMYLQARLRPERGEMQARALGDFYAAMFTLTLEASHFASEDGFREVIACVRNVRDAWAIAARDPAANRVLPRELQTRDEAFAPMAPTRTAPVDEPEMLRWSA